MNQSANTIYFESKQATSKILGIDRITMSNGIAIFKDLILIDEPND